MRPAAFVAAIGTLAIASTASAQPVPIFPYTQNPASGAVTWRTQNSQSFDANGWGKAAWDGTAGDDVGPSVNAAINAACLNGGGTVTLPAGAYFFATAIVVPCSGVELRGQGMGQQAAVLHPGPTELTWNGASSAGPALTIDPGNNSTMLFNNRLTGIEVNCADLVDTCISLVNVNSGNFALSEIEARKTGILLNSNNQPEQLNTFYINAANTNASFSATGLLIDRTTAVANVSANIFYQVNMAHGAGDGIVLGNTDSNIWLYVTVGHTGAAITGSPFVCTNGMAYTMPNGNHTLGTGGGCGVQTFLKGSFNGQWQGTMDNFTIVPNGGNTGSAALAPVTLATSSGTTANTSVLNFTSTTGVVAGEAASCGGTSSGIFPYSTVVSLTGTTVTLDTPAVSYGNVSGVASGTPCTFTANATVATSGLQSNGTYTLSSNGTTYTLTAPTNGHTQSGISLAGGALTFTDMVLPWSGVANNGDSWVINVGFPASKNIVITPDLANGLSFEHCSAGALNYVPTAGQASSRMLTTCGIGTRPLIYTVATLPPCPIATTLGYQLEVSDATAPAYAAAPTGGGTLAAQVTCTNSGWRLE